MQLVCRSRGNRCSFKIAHVAPIAAIAAIAAIASIAACVLVCPSTATMP